MADNLNGAAKDQLTTKVKVIKRLLKRIEREKANGFLTAKRKRRSKKTAEKPATKAPDAAGAKTANRAPASKDASGDLNVKTVPTRIVEKLPDGNYRVKGNQAFMIGQKEYKVIVTGVIRAEDFNEDGIDSGKVLDPRYDIVSNRRSLSL